MMSLIISALHFLPLLVTGIISWRWNKELKNQGHICHQNIHQNSFCLLVEGCCGVPGPICHPRHNDIPDSKAFVTQWTGDRSDSMLFILFTTLEYLCSAQSNIPLCSIRPPTQIQMLTADIKSLTSSSSWAAPSWPPASSACPPIPPSPSRCCQPEQSDPWDEE